jgi:uncharacterized lipoprotein YmbA
VIFAHRTVSLCGVLLTAACASPTTRFYVLALPDRLESVSVPAATATPEPTRLVASPGDVRCRVIMGRVTVPAIVDRPQLVLQGAPNRVTVLEQERWAEPLRDAVPRVLTESIRRHAPDVIVVSQSAGSTGSDSIRIAVDVERFTLGAGGVRVSMSGVITSGSAGHARNWSFAAGDSNPRAEYSTMIAAASRALDQIGGDLAIMASSSCGIN